jgi:hypothetical protein
MQILQEEREILPSEASIQPFGSCQGEGGQRGHQANPRHHSVREGQGLLEENILLSWEVKGGAHVSRSRLHRPMAWSRNTQTKRTSKRLSGPIFMRNASTWPSWLPCVQAPYGGPSDTMPSAKLLTRSWKGRTYIHQTSIRPPRKSYKNVRPSDCRSPSLR